MSVYAPNGLEIKRFPEHKRSLDGKIRILVEGDCAVDYKNVDESFEIIDALDITVLSDVDTGNTSNPSLLKATVQESLWDQMTTYLRTFCAGITLQDMIDRYRSSIPPDEAFMYYI